MGDRLIPEGTVERYYWPAGVLLGPIAGLKLAFGVGVWIDSEERS